MTRLKLDENLSVTLVEPLRALRHDVDTVADEKLQGAPDDRLLPAAAEADQVSARWHCGCGLRPA